MDFSVVAKARRKAGAALQAPSARLRPPQGIIARVLPQHRRLYRQPLAIIMFPTATAAEAANEPDDIALKVGLGVGIPVAVIIIAVLAAAWRIRRARKQRAVSSEVHHKAE